MGFAYDPISDGRTKIFGYWGIFTTSSSRDAARIVRRRQVVGLHLHARYTGLDVNAVDTSGNNTPTPACPGRNIIRRRGIHRLPPAVVRRGRRSEPEADEKGRVQHRLSRDQLNNLTAIVGRYAHKQDLVRRGGYVGFILPDGHAGYFIANPGEGLTLRSLNARRSALPKAMRDYDSVEAHVRSRFSATIGICRSSYTLSRLYGNYSGLSSSDEDSRVSPNVNRFFDHREHVRS